MEGLRQGQAQSPQCGVAGGDGQDDNAQQSDDAAHIAQDVSADHTDGIGSQGGVSSLQAQVVHAHGAGSPYHGDEALQNHHVVEGHAALLLTLHGAADDGRLSGVEAGQDAAGHSDKEHGQEVTRVAKEVILIAESRLSAVSAGGESQRSHPLVPQVQQGIAMGKDTHEHAHGGEQQDGAEDGVDAADDGVNGEHGGDQVIQEDHAVDDPGLGIGGSAGEAEHLLGGDVAGGVHEHGAHQQKQHAHKDVVHGEDALVGVLADHFGHLGTAVTQADHTAEVVVHCTTDDVADGDGDERDGAKQDALNGAQDGACACDVQQVDQAVLPAAHGHVVHAVLLGIGGGRPVVRPEDLFAQRAIEGGAAEEDDKADDEGCHTHTLLLLS